VHGNDAVLKVWSFKDHTIIANGNVRKGKRDFSKDVYVKLVLTTPKGEARKSLVTLGSY